MLTGAEALAALGLLPGPLRVQRWLVERGARLELDQPVLEATLPGAGRRVVVRSQHAAVVDRRFPSAGTAVAPASPLLTLSGVRAFVALPHRLTGTETGVLLTLPPSRPGGSDGATVTVGGLRTPVRWGSRVAFLLPPGPHEMGVDDPLGGPARTRATVAPGRLTAVRYDPPDGAGPGRLVG